MKKRYQLIKLDHEEWLKRKEKTIGGSEVAVILGKSKWMTLDELYNKMALGRVKNNKTNEKMEGGVFAEPHIRALFANDNKKFIVKNPPSRKCWFAFRKDKPYISCTPDGLMKNKETGGLWGLEIKNVDVIKREDKDAWEGGLLPDQYLYQIIQYMVVFNDMEGVVLDAHLKYYKYNESTNEFDFDYAVDKPYVLYRDDVKNVIDYLEREETKFVEEHVQKRKRPPLTIRF